MIFPFAQLMKNRCRVLLAVLALTSLLAPAWGQEKTDAASELRALVTKIQNKIRDGKRTEADLGDEVKEFDALIDKHKSEKTDDAAEIVLMKAVLYIEVFENGNKGLEIGQQLKHDYPDSRWGKEADEILYGLKREAEAKKIQRILVEGAKFPDFDEKDLAGNPLSVGNFKGKVVLIDFWATWCGPCIFELPNVVQAYEKNHDKGFEIIGVSLDQDEQRLRSFTKERKMTWQQFFDGKGWDNKLVQKYGVQVLPSTFLLDGEGKIIGKNLRGEALNQAVTKALAKN